VFLALAEIRRARLRFGLLAGAVGLLVFLVLFVQAITGNLVTQFIGGLQNQSAQVLVYGADARQNLEGSRVQPEQVEAVAGVAGVARAEPLGEGTFTVRAGGEVRDAVIFGHVPGGPGSPTTLTAGRQPAGEGEAVTGEGNGGSGFGLGDRVVVLPDGEPITIVGLARDIDYSVAPTLFAPYGTYLAARRTANPDALGVTPSAVAVAVDDGAEPGAVAQGINAAVPGVEALTRAEAVDRSPGVGAVRQSFLVVTILFYIAIPLIVGLFFVIITVQKAAALTLLRAIGAEGRTLVVALLTQVALVLAAGTAIALGLLAAAGAVLSAADFAVGVGIGAGTALTTLAVVIVLALLASMVAVRRVLATDPIEAAGGQGAGG
jgi:putative ABC transport system permease protein